MRTICLLSVCVIIVGAIGCSEQPQTPPGQLAPEAQAEYLLKTEPEKSEDVIQVRKDAKDGEDVVIVGRIGGKENPWVKGYAAFTLVDNSLKACSDIPGDNCPIPWDYCCELDKLPTSTAFIKVVDESGTPVKTDARALLNVKELSTVVVKGTAKRDDAGNLTVLAKGVFVKKK